MISQLAGRSPSISCKRKQNKTARRVAAARSRPFLRPGIGSPPVLSAHRGAGYLGTTHHTANAFPFACTAPGPLGRPEVLSRERSRVQKPE